MPRGYEGLFDPDELRDYADALNAEQHTASLPRGFRIASATSEPPEPPRRRSRRSWRTHVHDTPTGVSLDPDDEDDYPEPPVPLNW